LNKKDSSPFVLLSRVASVMPRCVCRVELEGAGPSVHGRARRRERRRCRALAALTQLSRLRAADSPPGRGSAPVGPLSYCSAVHNLINILYILRRLAGSATADNTAHQRLVSSAARYAALPIAQFHPRAAPGRFRRHANAPPNRHRIPLATTTRNAPHASDQNLLGLRPRGKEKDEPSFAFPPACGAGAESSCRQSRSPRPRDVSISSSSSLRTHSGPLRSHLVLSDLLSSSQKSFASALSCSLMRSRSAFRW
jgi:hypothetical protein